HWTQVKAYHRQIARQQQEAGVKEIALAHGLGFLLNHQKPDA
ncbi:fatty acid desaturase, partial [Pseudomonas sp. HMWF005]